MAVVRKGFCVRTCVPALIAKMTMRRIMTIIQHDLVLIMELLFFKTMFPLASADLGDLIKPSLNSLFMP